VGNLLRVLLVVVIALATWASDVLAQRAAFVAEKRFDLTGNGVLDVVRINNNNTVSVNLGKASTAGPITPFLTTGKKLVGGTLTIHKGGGYGSAPVIVAIARYGSKRLGTKPSREALVLTWDGGKLAKVFRADLGPQGTDGEYSLELEAGKTRLIKYFTRPGFTRCDGKTAYLFAEGFDFKSKKWRRISQGVRISNTAPVLTASRGLPAGVPAGSTPISFSARAASSSIAASGADSLSAPKEIDDGDPKTAWVEGKGGFGKGEFVTVRSGMDGGKVHALRIVPGHAASKQAFQDFNRLKRAGLLVGDKEFWLDIPTDPAGKSSGTFTDPYWIVFDEPIKASCVTLIVDDVYPKTAARKNRGRTAIAELSILTELDLTPGGPDAALAKRVAKGGSDHRRAARMLRTRGPSAITALATLAQSPNQNPPALLRLRRALAGFPPSVLLHTSSSARYSVSALVEGLATEPLAPADQELFDEALVKIGKASYVALAKLAMKENRSPVARQRALAALGRIPGITTMKMLTLVAGKGPPDLRKVLALTIAKRSPTELPTLMEATIAAAGRQPAIESDLWRAVGLLLRRARATHGRDAAFAELGSRLASAKGYELRYRLYAAAGSLDSTEVIKALAVALAANSELSRARTTALRRVAVAALASNNSAAAAGLAADFLADADPGVRRLAVDALSGRDSDNHAFDAALVVRLETDDWPEVRRASAGALGTRCSRKVPATGLFSVVDRDKDVEVRRVALGALVRCNATGIGDKLFEIVASAKQPVVLRTQAAILLGSMSGVDGAKMLALFRSQRKRAWSDEGSIRVAAALAVALANSGNQAASETLLSAAKDDAFPVIQAAALVALGKLCPRGAMAIFRRYRRSSEVAVKIAANGGIGRCKRSR